MTATGAGTLVFTVGGMSYGMVDVVRAARAWGDLACLTDTVIQGVACFKCAVDNGDLPTPEAVEAAAADFRYARDLISADEAQSWLTRHGLAVEDWIRYLHRTLLRERWASDLSPIVARYPVGLPEIEESLYAEGICSGAYGRVAQRLAGQVAVFERAREEKWFGERENGPPSLLQLEDALELLRASAVTPAAIRSEVAMRYLDWVRLECESVWFPDIHRAREAVLCVRDDGREFAQVAADAGTRVHRLRLFLEEAETRWRDRLLAARAGEVLGPLSQDDGFVLILVRAKELPHVENDDVRQQAEASLLTRAVEHEVTTRVTWHLRL